jgi:rRNA processing protein Gar1
LTADKEAPIPFVSQAGFYFTASPTDADDWELKNVNGQTIYSRKNKKHRWNDRK